MRKTEISVRKDSSGRGLDNLHFYNLIEQGDSFLIKLSCCRFGESSLILDRIETGASKRAGSSPGHVLQSSL